MVLFKEAARTAAAHHGLVERSRLLDIGVTPSMLQRWLTGGRLQVVQRGVYRLAGAPVTWEQQVLAAVLGAGPGAVASHRSAARLWGIHDSREIDVSSSVRRRRHLPGAVFHHATDLDVASSVHRSRIPVTDPVRALVDLGAVVGRAEVEDALDRAMGRRLVTIVGVERALERVARSGRGGVGALRKILDERALGADRADSLLEPRMARVLRSYGLPPPAFQHEVRHQSRFVARIDFAYPHMKLAIEVDGFASHSSPRALQSDLDRQNALVGLGWTVIRFTWPDVVRRPEKVAGAVGALIAARSPAAAAH